MTDRAFGTALTISGPYRAPRQMLATQEYGGHNSIHDDDKLIAQALLNNAVLKDSSATDAEEAAGRYGSVGAGARFLT